ncbi:GNAT family N-acetyltransferase [Desulfotruncus alcoholivorax]|uniref:GNAT family N-acetyltransferase n=1 Tax=Desulfotruncus alcoholivorax TaxID=265477 RepID=UPI000400616B|nr:GNAT family N-acetyltransferase [Desulfotruncus alcoholivorax]
MEINNTVIGWLSFSPFYNRPAYDATAEISIYIAEGYRGRGIGKKLLTTAIEESPKLGITTLLGFVFAHNKPSINLFTKMKFDRWGYLPGVASLDGIEKDLLILGLKIK